ncbi:methionyl-tRNA formyltransferase, mitochondrial isoform X2 [Lampetra fluviatilis]
MYFWQLRWAQTVLRSMGRMPCGPTSSQQPKSGTVLNLVKRCGCSNATEHVHNSTTPSGPGAAELCGRDLFSRTIFSKRESGLSPTIFVNSMNKTHSLSVHSSCWPEVSVSARKGCSLLKSTSLGLCEKFRNRIQKCVGSQNSAVGYHMSAKALNSDDANVLDNKHSEVRKKPPWRVLFFGSDNFALESLQALKSACNSGLLETLEVVALPKQTIPRNTECSPKSAASLEGLFTTYSHGAAWRHCHWRHGHEDPPTELIKTLSDLPGYTEKSTEQPKEGLTLAPKVNTSMCWVRWDQQTTDYIDRLYRAIGTQLPLRTQWMSRPIKLMNMVDIEDMSTSLAAQKRPNAHPGDLYFCKHSNMLCVRCQDGWVGFRTLVLKKKLSASDFYNGYLHSFFQEGHHTESTVGQSTQPGEEPEGAANCPGSFHTPPSVIGCNGRIEKKSHFQDS